MDLCDHGSPPSAAKPTAVLPCTRISGESIRVKPGFRAENAARAKVQSSGSFLLRCDLEISLFSRLRQERPKGFPKNSFHRAIKFAGDADRIAKTNDNL